MANEDFDPQGLSEDEIALLKDEGVEAEEDKPSEEEAQEDESVEEKAADAADEAKTETPADRAPPGFVPNQALQQARKEAQGYRDELRELRQLQNQIATKLAEQKNQSQQAEHPQTSQPNEEEDPIATIKWLKDQFLEQQQTAERNQQEQAQQQQANQQFQAMFNEVDMEFNQAAETDPSVNDAFEFAKESYSKELDALGYAPQQKDEQLLQFIYGFAQNYAQTGRARGLSIGDYVKRIAASRGWNPEAQTSDGQKTAEQEIEQQKKALAAGKTLSRGGAGNGETTLEDLAKMDGAELEKFAGKNPELFAKLTGMPA